MTQIHIYKQNKLLDEMDNFKKTMLVHSKKSFMPFQKIILLTNMSFRNLLVDFKTYYGLTYVILIHFVLQ